MDQDYFKVSLAATSREERIDEIKRQRTLRSHHPAGQVPGVDSQPRLKQLLGCAQIAVRHLKFRPRVQQRHVRGIRARPILPHL